MNRSSAATATRVLRTFTIDQLPPLTAIAASVFATMLFPSGEEDLVRLYCAQSIGLTWRAHYGPVKMEDHLPVLRRELMAHLDFAKQFPQSRLEEKQEAGISAGYLLKYVLLLNLDTTIEVASMKKAITLLSKFEPVGQRTLQTRWSAFKDVSHLWAALSDYRCTLQKVGPKWAEISWISFFKDPRPVLAVAENYRRWGIQHQPKGARRFHTLDAQTTWEVPENFGPLPTQDFFHPERLYLGLNPEFRKWLEHYRR